MKRLLVANLQQGSKSRYNLERFETMLKSQIENMLQIGWLRENIIFLSNFDFEFMDIKAEKIKFNNFCLSGSKMWGMQFLFDNDRVDDIIWSSDADCWQNIWFDCPSFSGDVGACTYSNPKWNGGSIFWKPSSKDIVDEVVGKLEQYKALKEEPLLNKIFNSEKYAKRISLLNSSFNVGCSGFIPRFTRSLKPIRVCHFSPPNSIAWEIFGLDREGIGEIAVTVRLERLLRKYYPQMATELKDKNVPAKKQAEEKEKAKRRVKKEEQRRKKNREERLLSNSHP